VLAFRGGSVWIVALHGFIYALRPVRSGAPEHGQPLHTPPRRAGIQAQRFV